jgi:hypothetical protein
MTATVLAMASEDLRSTAGDFRVTADTGFYEG